MNKTSKTSNAEHRTRNIESPAREFHGTEQSQDNYGNKRHQKFDFEERLLNFAVENIELTEGLPNIRAANHIAGQLLRSGTSPYGNHGEVEAAESINDFVHKLEICLKEVRETRRWLRLVARLKNQKVPPSLPCCLREADELIRINASVRCFLSPSPFYVRCSVFGVRFFLL